MMGHSGNVDGMESDAFSRDARRVIGWHRGELKLIKRAFAKRARKATKFRAEQDSKEKIVAFDDIRMEISSLFEQMTNQPEDAHELAEQIREMLNQMRATGMPVPQDLVDLEARLEADFGEGTATTPPVDLASTEARGEPAEGEGDDPLLDSPGAPPL